MQTVPGNNHFDSGIHPSTDAIAVRHRYSVDEMHAIARIHGQVGFPGVPRDTEPGCSAHERTIVTDAVMRCLAARGVVHPDHPILVAPYDLPVDIILSPELSCSVQRFRKGRVSAHNGFIRYGFLVEQSSPSEGVIELATSDVREFGDWLAATTGWSPHAVMRIELRQVPSTARAVRDIFRKLASVEPATLDNLPVVDAGHVVISRHRGSTVDGVDLAWITTRETRWVFTRATDVLFGFDCATRAEVKMQAATDSELTRAVLRAVRPIALSTARPNAPASV